MLSNYKKKKRGKKAAFSWSHYSPDTQLRNSTLHRWAQTRAGTNTRCLYTNTHHLYRHIVYTLTHIVCTLTNANYETTATNLTTMKRTKGQSNTNLHKKGQAKTSTCGCGWWGAGQEGEKRGKKGEPTAHSNSTVQIDCSFAQHRGTLFKDND